MAPINGVHSEDDAGGTLANPTHLMGAMTLIPQFSGEAGSLSVESFVKNVTSTGKLTKLTETDLAEVAKLRCIGAASSFLEASPDLEDTTWPVLKSKLLNHFSEKFENEKIKISNCIQNSAESAREFATRLKLVGLKSVKPCEEPELSIRQSIMKEEILNQFLKGLGSTLKHTVYSQNPETLEKAISIAEREEYFRSSEQQQQAVCTVTPTPAPRTSRRSDYDRDNRGRDGTPPRDSRYSSPGRSDHSRSAWNQHRDNRYRSSEGRSARSSSRGREDRRPWGREGRELSRDRRPWSRERGGPSRDNSVEALTSRVRECWGCGSTSHLSFDCPHDERRPARRSSTPYRREYSAERGNRDSSRDREPGGYPRDYRDRQPGRRQTSRDRYHRDNSNSREYQHQHPNASRGDRRRY